MEESNKPQVLLITCSSDEDTDFLVKGLIFSEKDDCSNTQPVEKDNENEIFSEYSWTLENKYYTADLSLISMRVFAPTFDIWEVVCGVEAIILAFEIGDEMSFHRAKDWAKFLEEGDIDIKLLVAKERMFIEALSSQKERVTKWCLDNFFELIELYSNDDKLNDIPEKFGFERVKEALGTHMWPNMVRHSDKAVNKQASKENKDNICETVVTNETKNVHCTEEDPLHYGTDTELQNFEEIFGKLHEMKLHAQTLSDEKRKEYAEQVTIAFWRSMGQDDDEIEGL